jgi:hypothetical protein
MEKNENCALYLDNILIESQIFALNRHQTEQDGVAVTLCIYT